MQDLATQRQLSAADPKQSTWLSANAGSGKTRVLIDRVIQLLLDHTNPQNILCLTYTNAAANEMQNRLFSRLGEWSMLADTELETELRKMGHDPALDADLLSRARRLFALAIETPGGLKIQTIHSLCAALLRQFPIESHVAPQFVEIDEATTKELRRTVTEQIASEEPSLIQGLMTIIDETHLDQLTGTICKNAHSFQTEFDRKQASHILGNARVPAEENIEQNTFGPGDFAVWQSVIEAMKKGSDTEYKNACLMENMKELTFKTLSTLEGFLLFKTGAKAFQSKNDHFPNKATRAELGDKIQDFNALMDRVETARKERLCLEALNKAEILHRFAGAFLKRYEAAKSQRGWLDFDDLIHKMHKLLTDPDVSAWVLYKLDGRIDHVLVDEAQDTSPAQWTVIKDLIHEFTSGEGRATDRNRTLFVVGDKKQSIYSFQGADTSEFDRTYATLKTKFSDVEQAFQNSILQHSFRSSPAILKAVDVVYDQIRPSWFDLDQAHIAYHQDMPGRVDVWPALEPEASPEDPDWFDPIDQVSDRDVEITLANHIASYIRKLIEDRHPIPDGDQTRPVEMGDFLILVQKRTGKIFHPIIRACKAEGLDVSGPDKILLMNEIAVQDILALLKFLATPEDDLSLAVALKSPLFSWDEQALFDLAQGRAQKYLWAELRDKAKQYPETTKTLFDLLGLVDYLRPYELIERILIAHEGRKKLIARLGPESENSIDLLLSQAMAFEQTQPGSLTGFLAWMESETLEVKRPADTAGNQIRIMTTHGAKGLESPIVILPDTRFHKPLSGDKLMKLAGLPFLRAAKDDMPDAMSQKAADLRRAEQEERDRLLYVAMTRAEKWLIVANAGPHNDQSWYRKIQNGLSNLETTDIPSPAGQGKRYATGVWPETTEIDPKKQGDKKQTLDACYFETAATPLRQNISSPSGLGGAKAIPSSDGRDEKTATEAGHAIHTLLQHLPDHDAESWENVARHLLGDDFNNHIYKEAVAVITDPKLQFLFSEQSLAEVELSAPIPMLDNQRFRGIIDRLIVTETDVWAVDFKSNAAIPSSAKTCPEGLLRQMGAYMHMLHQLYPTHNFIPALVWTKSADLMILPHDMVSQALQNTKTA